MSLGGWLWEKTAGAAQRKRRETESRAKAAWIQGRSAFHQMKVPISEQQRRVKACILGVKMIVVLLFVTLGAAVGRTSISWSILVYLFAVIIVHWVFDGFNVAGARLAKWIYFGDFELDPLKDKDAYNLEAELRCLQAATNMEAWMAMDPGTRRKFATDLLGSLQSLSTARDFSSNWNELQTLASKRPGGPTLPMYSTPEADEPDESEVMDAEVVVELPAGLVNRKQ